MFRKTILLAIDLDVKLYKVNMYDLGEISF